MPRLANGDARMTRMPPLPVGNQGVEQVTKTYRFSRALHLRALAIAHKHAVSDNKMVAHLIEWACNEYEAEFGVPPPAPPEPKKERAKKSKGGGR
jgi:hypothetical protein